MGRFITRLWMAGLLGGLLLTACSDDSDESGETGPPALVAPAEAADSAGPFAVGHQVGEVYDSSRDNRVLPYDVWYPSDETPAEDVPHTFYSLQGPIGLTAELAVDDLSVSAHAALPLVVFSHGFRGIKLQSMRMMEALASHGFVVVTVEHTGNTNDDSGDDHQQAGENRVPDVSAVIDAFLARNTTQGDDFSGRLDAEAIGVVGHSFGGGTALGMVAGFYGQAPDERVVAVMPISATVFERFTDESLAAVEEPVLLLGGTEDTSVPIENHDYAFDNLTGAEAVYQVDITGAGHNHFAAICDIGDALIDNGLEQSTWPAIGAAALVPVYEDACGESAFPIDVAQRIQHTYAIAFFRRFLLGESEYDYYLSEEWALANEPDVVFSSRAD